MCVKSRFGIRQKSSPKIILTVKIWENFGQISIVLLSDSYQVKYLLKQSMFLFITIKDKYLSSWDNFRFWI